MQWRPGLSCVLVVLVALASSAAGDDIAPYSEGHRAFMERMFVEPSHIVERSFGNRRPKPLTTGQMRDIIAEYAEMSASGWTLERSQLNDRVEQCDAIMDAIEVDVDPAFVYIHNAYRQRAQMGVARAAFNKPTLGSGKYPQLLSLLAAARQTIVREQDANSVHGVCKAIESALQAGHWHPNEIRLAFGDLSFALDAAGTGERVRELLDTIEPMCDVWLFEMLQGVYHRNAAWAARGSGFAHEVTDDGWTVFYEELEHAAEHFVAAHELAPNRPEAATALIEVAMAAGPVDGKDERGWFESAIAAQPDWTAAYERLLWALRPRWGGSHEAMLELGLEAYRTNEFTTRVPYQLINAIEDIASDIRVMAERERAAGPPLRSDPYAILERPDVYSAALETLEAYAERDDLPPPVYEQIMSKIVAYAWRADDDATAHRALGQLGERRFVATEAARFGIAEQALVEDVHLRSSAASEEVKAADRFFRQADYDGAVRAYESALNRVHRDRDSAAIVRRRMEAAKFGQRVSARNEFDIRFGRDFPGWHIAWGEPFSTPEGDLAFPPVISGPEGMAVISAVPMGTRWQITGTVSFDPYAGRGAAGIAPAVTYEPSEQRTEYDTVAFALQHDRIHHVQYNIGGESGRETVSLDAEATAFMLVRFDNEVMLAINGEEVFRKNLSDDAGTHLGFMRPDAMGEFRTEFRNLRFKRLSTRPW